MHRNNVRIRCTGRPVSGTSRLPRRDPEEMGKAVEKTSNNTGLNFTLAFDYGSREELIHAARVVVAEFRRFGESDHGRGDRDHPHIPEIPPVDLLVRTSGEHRLSNFLWQTAGAPLYVTPTNWPDFDRHELDSALTWWCLWPASDTWGWSTAPRPVIT